MSETFWEHMGTGECLDKQWSLLELSIVLKHHRHYHYHITYIIFINDKYKRHSPKDIHHFLDNVKMYLSIN